MTFGLHRRINESKADVKFQRVLVTGKQALDFQLCSYLGFLICDTMGKTDSEESSNNYYIVSNDNGYVVLTEYWKKRKINLTVVSNLKKESINAVQKISAQPNNKADALTVKLNTILKDKTSISEAVKIINNAKTKMEVNNNLGKKFNTKKV